MVQEGRQSPFSLAAWPQYTFGKDSTEGTEIEYTKPITIRDNVWLAGRCIINPDVTVGNNAIIASGAVVIKGVPAHIV